VREKKRGEPRQRTELILPVVGGITRPIDIIPWDLAQASHVDASSRFASMLEEELENVFRLRRGRSSRRRCAYLSGS
jgi:hypothetical protein